MRAIHPDFFYHLKFYDENLIDNFVALRNYILELAPNCNELLYHTHALTSVFTTSAKLSDGFCMIPIYSEHFNLGFHKGTLLNDPHQLLQGTGKLIRHIPITAISDFKNAKVEALIVSAIKFSKENMKPKDLVEQQTISKIKK